MQSTSYRDTDSMVDLTKILNQPIPPMSHFDVTYKLLDGLCRSTEQSIQQSIDDYNLYGADFEEIDYDPQYGPIGFEHYNNITHFDVLDLDETVTVHFPSMQRRSVLLTIFGIFEHELEEFCNVYARKHQLSVKVADFKGSGIERSATYIKKVMGINTPSSTLKKLQKLRNACAHQDAKYKLPDGQKIKEIADLVNEYPNLIGTDTFEPKVILKAGFLNWVLTILGDYFRNIEEELRNNAP